MKKNKFIMYLAGLLSPPSVKSKLIINEINLRQIDLPVVTVDGASIFMLERLKDIPCERAFNPSGFQQVSAIKKAISSIVVIEESEVDKYDFKKLETFSASKSFSFWHDEDSWSASYYEDVLEWGKNMYEADNFGFSTNYHFERNKRHLSFEGVGSKGYINVHIYSWHNSRALWVNTGGSHHATALIRQLSEQRREFYCKAKITNYSINPEPLNLYENDFHIFLAFDLFTNTNGNHGSSLSRELRRANIVFHSESIRLHYHIRPIRDRHASDGFFSLYIIPKFQSSINPKYLSNWVDLMVKKKKLIDFFELSKSPGPVINRHINHSS